ncbi:MAG: type II toxin-antitoxin system VapC family toxin [Deltaproteobacteria bacterium]|nr:type II toxin-antitoxin system VapC family toxin [Deltaproteobacteria bacterium]
MIVVDTNVIAYLLIQGERTDAARAVWQRDPQWLAPPLWRSEFLNVLAVSVRAQVLSESDARKAWSSGLTVMGHREVEVSGSDVLAAAIKYRLSAYDAQFVVAAAVNGTRLVTGDRRIPAACPELSVELDDFVRGG